MPSKIGIFEGFDVTTSAAYTYGRYMYPVQAPKYLLVGTSANADSVVVSSLNAGDAPFRGIGVGDFIEVRNDGSVQAIKVAGVLSAPDAVSLATSAVGWNGNGQGRPFTYRKFSSGITSTSGWFGVVNLTNILITAEVTAFAGVTSIDLIVEGRINTGLSASGIRTVWSKSFTGTGTDFKEVTGAWDEMRVGAKITGNPSGANLINVFFKGDPKEARP